MSEIEKRARELLAMTLGERGFHCEAENVRAGEDLESYEGELQAIAQLLRLGFNNVQEHKQAALTPPEDPVAEVAKRLIGRFMIECNAVGAYEAGYGLARSLKREMPALLAARPEVSGG